MKNEFSRRKAVGALVAVALQSKSTAREPGQLGLPQETAATPKLCLPAFEGGGTPNRPDERGMRRVSQLGVTHVIMVGPPIPWEESEIRARMDLLKRGGLTLANMMLPWGDSTGGMWNTIYGRPGRDEEIENVKKSIRAAGRAGLPVVEYNFYAHRITEGYFESSGRGGAGMTSFDYEKIKSLPPLPNEGAHSLEEMWANITYFLNAVVRVAEQSNVRLALHPNDPPAPVSRGSGQIMGTLEGWKRLIEIVPSKSNGITFDCGVTREMGHDPVEVCRYFGSRDRINHVHFRNVRTLVPHQKYSEVFPDEGQVNMLAVMKELVLQKYPRLVFPEHPRVLDADRENPKSSSYASWAFNVGYARAALQAVLLG
jgi:mannonate dehydratase